MLRNVFRRIERFVLWWTLSEEEERDYNEWKNNKMKPSHGVQAPIVIPTDDEMMEATKRYQYQYGKRHIAVSGATGCGKSTFINAIRGLGNRDSDSGVRIAPTGVTETTREFGCYPDPKTSDIWYDIPGAGTLSIPAEKYFNTQGLFVFDCIIILFDSRFTETDIAILKRCAYFNIPYFLVRAKSALHIQNFISDLRDDEDYEGWDESRLKMTAQSKFINETWSNVTNNLARAGLQPPQRVYCIDRSALIPCCRGEAGSTSENVIDEIDLIKAIRELPLRKLKF
ncbi:hypothetical protein WOLCODRAFT_167389 [Wolfiporia cocos MD-104 SS10]|uniref:IRG-type G domain-containing protein n=1 Tax=Wolfiporia cocos (strain MD-104) TaxID=742152 RepID=A0A2H3J6D2_WOLCO|nr:hypothetical protein WOLCODRAFT_167389 [Wolfiporia cocos MD-104 SS10]